MTEDQDRKQRIREELEKQGLCPEGCNEFLEPTDAPGVDRCPKCKMTTHRSQLPTTQGSAS